MNTDDLNSLAHFLADPVTAPCRLPAPPHEIGTEILRLVTLACAGVILLSSNGYDHFNAGIPAGIALARP